MRGASLFVVFLVARILGLQGRPLPDSVWAPLAYVWQDAAVAISFYLVFDRLLRRVWPARIAYALLVGLVAVNVPVMRVLGTPITAPMLRATRGALADSLRHHATAPNLGAVALVIILGALVPVALGRLRARARAAPRWDGLHGPPRTSLGMVTVACIAVTLLVAGAWSASRIDTGGLERNVLVALTRSTWPRVTGTPSDADFRLSLSTTESRRDLTRLRGSAAGRHVVLVVLESTAAQYLAPYGSPRDPAPNLTAFASEALVFDHAYAVYPESVKGLVSILAARYPAFDVPAEDHGNLLSSSLAGALGAQGYQTGLFHSGRFMYLGMEELLAKAGFGRLEDAGDIGGNHNSSFGIDESATVARVLAWIDSVPDGTPFFATYLPIAGHHPYASTEPGPFSEAEEFGRYRNAIHEGDRALGRLLDGLRSRGLDRSTIVVVLADHGEAFGQHAGNYAHTLALYEENVRVPLMIAAPGLTQLAGRARRVASLVDVAPTILDLLGLALPTESPGVSLLAGAPRAALFFTDYSLGLLGLRDGCRKLVYEMESSRSTLFDVCRDPAERTDIARANRALVEIYRERLVAWASAEVSAVRRSTGGSGRGSAVVIGR